jgi:hypothetical protein
VTHVVRRPSFDEALAFWHAFLRARSLPARLTWVFREDFAGPSLRPRSTGAGEWLARRIYQELPAADPLVFAACASADGHTVTALQTGSGDAQRDERRDDWNLLFDSKFRLQDALPLAPLRERLTEAERLELRREALRDLALFTSPLPSVQHSLSDFAWDSDELSMLDKQHVLQVLRRFDAGELADTDVEAWANAIEMRDDIGYDRETAVWDVLFELANPILTEALTRERADVLASVLKGH